MPAGDTWDRVYEIPSGTDYADAIRGVLTDRFPWIVCEFDATGLVTPRLRLGATPGSSPWQDAEDMAEAVGYELAFDDDGACTLTKAGRLDRSPRKNWVEERGGLPDYIDRIAAHLHAKGMAIPHAIATAINAAKKMCSTGDLNWPGLQHVNLGSKAQACAAVARWEAMKAAARAKKKTADAELDDDAFAAVLAEHVRWDDPDPDPDSPAADEVAASARKAASMDLALAYAEIVKTAPQADGSLMVHGKATDGSLDLDQQRCDPTWLSRAMPEWFRSAGNIREQHDAKRAVGKATEHEVAEDGHYITAKIVDPVAKAKVQAGVFTGFSIGVKAPRIAKSADAPGGVITDGKIVEVSLVDRPCNPNATLTVCKAATPGWEGSPEDLDEERGLVRCEELAEKTADQGAEDAAVDSGADESPDADAPAATDAGAGGETADPATPEFDIEAAKTLVADVLKADTATDIADAQRAIGIIGTLIASEAAELVDKPSQTYDIRLLLDAATALRAFIHSERAEERRDAAAPAYAEMAADAVTEAAQADLGKSTDPADRPEPEEPDATKATVADGGGAGTDGPDLIKTLTDALGEDEHPLRKLLTSIVKDSTTKAAAASITEVMERLEKVEQMATPGGPALRRTDIATKNARRDDLVREAARFRALEAAADDHVLRTGYAKKAAALEAESKTL